VSAGLKVHGLALDPLAQDSFLSSPRVQIAAIEVETVLGLWLLSGWSARAAWVTTLAFFGVLASASLYLALTGQRSCGCFGRVEVNPWWTFALDLGVIATLVLVRPLPESKGMLAPRLWTWLRPWAGAAVSLSLIGGAFVLAFDNPYAALARLRGESITIEPVVSAVGDGEVGWQRKFPIRLRNHTDRPVRLYGGTTSCSCIATDDLPITLPGGGTETLEVQVRFAGSPGRFRHRFVLLSDDAVQPKIVAYFSGQVLEPRE
jgi:hypothetical protein